MANTNENMTREAAIDVIKCLAWHTRPSEEEIEQAIKTLKQEQKPYEKFENVKDHINKLAGDYKCWDNRLTADEALELCHILEQQSVLDKIRAEMFEEMASHSGTGEEVIQAYADGLNEGIQIIDKYKAEVKEPSENAVNREEEDFMR